MADSFANDARVEPVHHVREDDSAIWLIEDLVLHMRPELERLVDRAGDEHLVRRAEPGWTMMRAIVEPELAADLRVAGQP